MPGISPNMNDPEFWLERAQSGPTANDAVLLDATGLEQLAAAGQNLPGGPRRLDDPGIFAADHVRDELEERRKWLADQLADGSYIEAQPGSFAAAVAITETAQSSLGPSIHAIVERADIRCVPMFEALLKAPIDPDFDRNNCSSVHPGEWVRVLARGTGRAHAWLYVHAGHSVGWVFAPKLGPSLSDEDYGRYLQRPHLYVLRDGVEARGESGQKILELRMGTRWAIGEREAGAWLIERPIPDGYQQLRVTASEAVHEGPAALTRRALFRATFDQLGQPYGWGGRAGARDCSRLLLDAYAGFGLELGRHSKVQSLHGNEVIDVGSLDELAKRAAIRAASERGTVLLYMPGHIMLYLGWTEANPNGASPPGAHDYAISAISGFKSVCPGGGDQMHRIDRTVVSDLEVGRNTERRAFLERITTITVIGGTTAKTAPPSNITG